MDWQEHARRLAAHVTYRQSPWHEPVATTPRHQMVPRWWRWPARGSEHFELCDGLADEQAWMQAAYSDETLITAVASKHADHAASVDRATGRPTSSATLPSLVLRMYDHARLYDGADVLDVGTGSGYGCGLLCARLGDAHVTSIDIDPYASEAARARLDAIGRHPELVTGDANWPLPGSYDRIVAMVSMPNVPPSWLAALRPGGRLVTVIAGTAMIITADRKQADDDSVYAEGRVERDWAMFMPARTQPDYPPTLDKVFAAARTEEGETVSLGRFPVLRVPDSWELTSLLQVTVPGVEHAYSDEDGKRTALMAHPDGSWARAAATGDDPPLVHQSGPRRLWDLLEDLRATWLRDGHLPLFGAKVFITRNGACHLARGQWRATIR